MTIQASFAQALLDPERDCPSGLKTWNGSDPAMRFAVYRNNVAVSLIDALADSFPVTQALVGEEFFRAMARVYIPAHPPRVRVLTWAGAAFPDFIESFPPAATLPYLADVARLEMLRIRAYHAADTPALDVQDLSLALADPDALLTLRLTLHPSVHVLRSRYAVFSLWAAHQGEVCISTVDPTVAEAALIFRRNLDVEVMHLTAAESFFVHQLQIGGCLASIADEAVHHDHEFDLTTVMATLIRGQLICNVSNGEDGHENAH